MSDKAIRETAGFLAVVASMVFVGMEIRQNTTVARAATRQALSDTHIGVTLAVTIDEGFASEFARWNGWEGEPPDVFPEEFERMRAWIVASLRHRENVFLQWQEGVIDESALLGYGWAGRNRFYESPLFEPFWEEVRALYHPDFVVEFESRLSVAR